MYEKYKYLPVDNMIAILNAQNRKEGLIVFGVLILILVVVMVFRNVIHPKIAAMIERAEDDARQKERMAEEQARHERRKAEKMRRQAQEAAITPEMRIERERRRRAEQEQQQQEEKRKQQEAQVAREQKQREIYDLMLANKDNDAYESAVVRWRQNGLLILTRDEFFETLLDIESENYGWEAQRWTEHNYPNPWDKAAKEAARSRGRGGKGGEGGSSRDVALAMEALRNLRS